MGALKDVEKKGYSIHVRNYKDVDVARKGCRRSLTQQQVVTGTLDIALITGVPDTSKLNLVTIADNPFYVALSMKDELAAHREVRLEQLHNRNWILLGQHTNPYLFDTIQVVASDKGVRPTDIHPFTTPDEASELIREYRGLAFLSRPAAWRIARDGITMRPLAEDRLRLVTKLATRINNKSRLVNKFVRAAVRKLNSAGHSVQVKLPLTG